MLKALSKSDATSSDDLSFWSAPSILQALLGYSIFAYAIGYLTLTVDAHHFGFALPAVSKEQIVWAGILPTLLLLAAVILVRLQDTEPIHGKPLPSRKIAEHLIYLGFFIFVPILAGFEIASLLYGTFGEYGRNDFGRGIRMHLGVTVSIGAVCFLMFMLWGFYRIAKRRWHITENKSGYKWTYGTGVAWLASTFIYVFAFPLMPLRFGFGRPSFVNLVISEEYAGVLPMQAVPSTEKLRTTVPVEMMMKTEKEYVVRIPASGVGSGPKVVSLGSEAVKALIWVP